MRSCTHRARCKPIAQDLLAVNSGLHISTNGRAFADTLEQLVKAWPVPVEELTIIGHSMGGLVTRSACHHTGEARHAWPTHLKALVFLGTPHHGAPLERAGNRANLYIGISPYTAPFARLGKLRSVAIQDLRHGNLLDSDWQGLRRATTRDTRTPVPLPRGVKCFAVAATKRAEPASLPSPVARLPGDGLVPVASALGRHKDARFALAIPRARTHLCFGLDHFDLLSSGEVFQVMRDWLVRELTRSPIPPARR